ncbi:ATP-binding protein [Streptomyces sp. WAC07149]|uniref:ATP-binding protein n=1 Tax=Streptomyces sp. WAC07149 TaxID=2487425 RepID=UPI000F79D7A8|nr:ATP-binding protein [Streptomyces sp. WAC07149]RST00948.1 ATP-binding protein [Streptomyces sp. WAC07149]
MEVHEVTLPVTGPEGAARARRTVMDEVSGWRRGAVTGDLHGAETVAGELLANAVLHGDAGTASITARLRGDRLRFEVRDQSAAVPRKRAGHPDAEHGRGLLIIAALADEHGVEQGSSGKSCWAEFDLAPRPTTSVFSQPLDQRS